MTIVVTMRRLTDTIERELAARFTLRAHRDDAAPPDDALLESCRDAAVLISTSSDAVSAGLIERLPASIRLIANFGAGLNTIDVAAAARRGIKVTYTPGAVAEDTADLAFGLMIATCRRFVEGDRLARSGEWRGLTVHGMLGQRVHGKVLGIVGMGRVGAAVARRAAGFGMTVLYHNRQPRPDQAQLGAAYCPTLDGLLDQADVVMLCCPLTEATRHLMDGRALARMKPGAVLVNVGRGPVVDQAALAEALRSGTIAAAGLDVYEFEPSIEAELRALPNTVLLPHLGTATDEGRNGIGRQVIANIEAFLATGSGLDEAAP